MRKFLIALSFLFLSCLDDLDEDVTLSDFTAGKELVLDNIIACAASNENDDLVSVFLYPRSGATNIRYYEAENGTVDKNDFNSYILQEPSWFDVFNGFLKKFEVEISEEKWVIVSFEAEGKIHLSNPIRIKNSTKPTEYTSDNVTINASTNMPVFTWEDGIYNDTRIYFQVVTDEQNNLISGTYTFERSFEFYTLDNVVLNITPVTPGALLPKERYGFTLLAVSEDNWVNLFYERPFMLE